MSNQPRNAELANKYWEELLKATGPHKEEADSSKRLIQVTQTRSRGAHPSIPFVFTLRNDERPRLVVCISVAPTFRCHSELADV